MDWKEGLGGKVFKAGQRVKDIQQQYQLTLNKSTRNKNHIRISREKFQKLFKN